MPLPILAAIVVRVAIGAAAKVIAKRAAAALAKKVAQKAIPKAIPKAVPKAIPKAAPKPAAPKPAPKGGSKGPGNTAGKHKAKSKAKKAPRFKGCGKFGKHKDIKKLSKRGELNSDHIPSGAALKKAFEEQLREARIFDKLKRSGALGKVLRRMYNEAPTIATPEDVHKDGRTHSGKNTSKQSDGDSRDLKSAAKKDTDAIKESINRRDPGCLDAYEKAAEKLKKFDFKKFFDEQMKKDPDVSKYLKKGK